MQKYTIYIDSKTTKIEDVNNPENGFGLVKIKEEGMTYIDLSNIDFEKMQIIPKKLTINKIIKLLKNSLKYKL